MLGDSPISQLPGGALTGANVDVDADYLAIDDVSGVSTKKITPEELGVAIVTSATTVSQSGSGAVSGTVAGQFRKFTFLSDWTTEAQFNLARDALYGPGGRMAVPHRIDFAPPLVAGSTLDYGAIVMKFRNPDPDHGDFNFVSGGSPGIPPTTKNATFGWGYNFTASGKEDASEPMCWWAMETHYNNLMEMHFSAISTDGTDVRLWSWGIDRTNCATVHSVRTDFFEIYTGTGVANHFSLTANTMSLAGVIVENTSNNALWLTQENAAGNANIPLIHVNASDQVHVAPGGAVTKIGDNIIITGDGGIRGVSTNVSFRNGVADQAVLIYSNYTDASNGAWLNLAAGAGGNTIFSVKNGSGANEGLSVGTTGNADLALYTNGASRWRCSGGAGHIIPYTDATHDIGESGSTRVRHYYGTGHVLIQGAGGGVGYGTGAGGTVTQLTDKSTAVELNKATGEITMHNAALNAGVSVTFQLNNSGSMSAGDYLAVQHVSGGTVGSYKCQAVCGGGFATITVTNTSGGNLSEAIVLKFVLLKAATT